ncbi:MAG TPA: MMPL family transporter [Methylomirabilota bacterium]|nr:MMPL family transporter [Methylomirabilota bacterium]
MKRALPIFLLWLLFVAVGLSKLRFDVQVLNLLPKDIPAVEALGLYEERFGQTDELIIAIRGSDPEALESAAKALAETLRQQSNLVAHAHWQPPWQENPGQTGELLAYMWLNANPTNVQALAARLAPARLAKNLEELKTALATTLSPQDLMMQSYDPLGLSRVGSNESALQQGASGRSFFASEDGLFRMLFVESAHPLKTFPECRDWLQQIRTLVERSSLPAIESIAYTGRPAFVAEISAGMEKDVSGSVGGTAVVIAILFWLAHRSFKPLFLLLACLAVALITMLALGGLAFGALNVVSLGFAAILLGLGVDYGLLIYQERAADPNADHRELRRHTQPGIFWSAVTTSGAFALLNFGGLPGLSQLGSLIAIGVVVAAVVMLYLFLPGVLRLRLPGGAPQSDATLATPPALITGILVFVTATVLLAQGFPRMDTGTEALRPRNTPAYDAMEAVKTNVTGRTDPFWLLARGKTPQELTTVLERAEQLLNAAVGNGIISSFDLPTTLAPNSDRERLNRSVLEGLLRQREAIRTALLQAGFDETSWALASHIFITWERALSRETPFVPQSTLSGWVLKRALVVNNERAVALGAVQPLDRGPAWQRLKADLHKAGALVAGWDELGRDLFARVRSRVPLVLGAIVLLSLICLWKAFGSWREVALGVLTLLFALWCLLAVMKLANWSWNLMNMVALPLLIGAGVDYTIHVQLALKREGGSLLQMWRKVGRALLLSAGTTIAGFGSLAWAGNAGLASLGLICAVGLTIICFTAIWLLPAWWTLFARPNVPAAK